MTASSSFRSSRREQRKATKDLRYKTIHIRRSMRLSKSAEYLVQFIAGSLFVGAFLMVAYGQRMLDNWIIISRIYVAIVMIFILIPLRFYPRIFRLHPEFKYLFTFASAGPTLCGLLLLFNFYFNINQYPIQFSIEKISYFTGDAYVQVWVNDPRFNRYQSMRTFQINQVVHAPHKVEYTIGMGFLHLEVVRDKRLIYE